MKDQIITTNMSAAGDSSSLVLSLDKVAVGLLFAGCSIAMIANRRRERATARGGGADPVT